MTQTKNILSILRIDANKKALYSELKKYNFFAIANCTRNNSGAEMYRLQTDFSKVSCASNQISLGIRQEPNECIGRTLTITGEIQDIIKINKGIKEAEFTISFIDCDQKLIIYCIKS